MKCSVFRIQILGLGQLRKKRIWVAYLETQLSFQFRWFIACYKSFCRESSIYKTRGRFAVLVSCCFGGENSNSIEEETSCVQGIAKLNDITSKFLHWSHSIVLIVKVMLMIVQTNFYFLTGSLNYYVNKRENKYYKNFVADYARVAHFVIASDLILMRLITSLGR